MDTLVSRLSGKTKFLSNNSSRSGSAVQSLDSIAVKDQAYRAQMDDARKKFGGSSDQMKQLFKNMRQTAASFTG